MEVVTGYDSAADEVVEELLPAELDWQRLVRRYPLASLTLAAIGGYVLGSTRGFEIVESISHFAADTLTESANQFLGKDVL